MPDFRLNDVPGNPGLKSNFRNMGMELPVSLPRQSVDEFLKENRRCGTVHSVVPLRGLPNLHIELLHAWPERFTGFAGLRHGRRPCQNAGGSPNLRHRRSLRGHLYGTRSRPSPPGWLMTNACILSMPCARNSTSSCLFCSAESFTETAYRITTSTPRRASKSWQETFRNSAYCFLMPAVRGRPFQAAFAFLHATFIN